MEWYASEGQRAREANVEGFRLSKNKNKKYNGVMRRVLGNFPGGIYLKAYSTKVTQRLYEKGFF